MRKRCEWSNEVLRFMRLQLQLMNTKGCLEIDISLECFAKSPFIKKKNNKKISVCSFLLNFWLEVISVYHSWLFLMSKQNHSTTQSPVPSWHLTRSTSHPPHESPGILIEGILCSNSSPSPWSFLNPQIRDLYCKRHCICRKCPLWGSWWV